MLFLSLFSKKVQRYNMVQLYLLSIFTILFNFIINGFLLTLAIGYTLSIISFVNKSLLNSLYTRDSSLLVAGYTITALILLIGLTEYGYKFARLFLNTRDLLPHEKKLLYPILEETQQFINKKLYPKQITNVKLLVGGNAFNNLQILGRNTIIVNNTLINDIILNTCPLSSDEIRTLFLRELGCLYHKEGVFVLEFWYSGLIAVMLRKGFNYCSKFKTNLLNFLSHTTPKIFSRIVQLIIYLIILIFSPILIISWITKPVINLLILYINRQFEYEADKFIANLGCYHELINALTKVEILNFPAINTELAQMLSPKVDNATRIKKLTNKVT